MEEDIRKKLEQWYDKKLHFHDSYCTKFKGLLEEIIKSSGIPYQSISGRVKGKESFLEKCNNKKYNDPTNEIMDIVGVRIIAYTNSDVNTICDIIEQEFSIDPDNSENKADKMKENEVGYLSVHYIARLNDTRSKLRENMLYKELRCEIQVRTLLQHAWAEIEHDRNYKFGGVLPKDIKRRFALAAAMLEMVDREFQNLSNDIDKYREDVKQKAIEGELNILIDSTSLYEFMLRKFNYSWIEPNFGEGGKEIIEELSDYGISTLEELDKIIPKDFIKVNEKINNSTTFLGLLRDIMVVNDYKKYFDYAWNNNWDGIDDITRQLYEHYGLQVDNMMSTYNLIHLELEDIFIPDDEGELFEFDDEGELFELDDEGKLFEPDDDPELFEPDDDFEPFESDDDFEIFESDDEVVS